MSEINPDRLKVLTKAYQQATEPCPDWAIAEQHVKRLMAVHDADAAWRVAQPKVGGRRQTLSTPYGIVETALDEVTTYPPWLDEFYVRELARIKESLQKQEVWDGPATFHANEVAFLIRLITYAIAAQK